MIFTDRRHFPTPAELAQDDREADALRAERLRGERAPLPQVGDYSPALGRNLTADDLPF